jgi:alanine dehydrogenase
MLILSEAEVAELLALDDAFSILEAAFAAQAAGGVDMPLRTIAAAPGGVLGCMPCRLAEPQSALGAKLVTFFPGNAGLHVPTHNALIALFDPASGVPDAVMDGRYITEVRTAVVSALATRALANPGASRLAILGTGVQARAHLRSLAHVMNIADVAVWGRRTEHAEQLVREARDRGLPARTTQSVEEACRGAEVICTLTSAREPVLASDLVAPGAHVNAVGFGGPAAREIAGDLMARARLIVDSLEGAFQESGNIRLAMQEGRLPLQPEVTRLCDVLTGRAPGRRAVDDVTLFNSLGIALEDLACAHHVLERARAQGIGTPVSL